MPSRMHERKQRRFRNGNWHERASARASRERIWFANLGKFPTLPRGVLSLFPAGTRAAMYGGVLHCTRFALQDALRIPRRHAAEKRRAVAWILISPRLVAGRAMYSGRRNEQLKFFEEKLKVSPAFAIASPLTTPSSAATRRDATRRSPLSWQASLLQVPGYLTVL